MIGRLGALALGVLLFAACGGADRAEQARKHLERGKTLLAEGRYEAALPELQKSVELRPESVEAQTLLGNAHRGLKRYDQAFEAYRAAKKIDRYVPLPHIENARALVEVDQIEEAISQLNHVIEIDPRNLEAMLLLGEVSLMERPLAEGGRGVPRASLERAELNLEAAAALAPDNVQVHYELALVREKLDQPEQARESWARVQALAADRPEHARLRAEAAKALARPK